MSAVIIRDEIVHYEVLGRGRPLIFLHGWIGSWRYWIPAMQAASTSFRAYALDLWGFGDTGKKTDSYSLEHQFYLLDDFLQEMGIGKIALIGHGLGAVLGLLYAKRFPKFVDRVMAVSLPNGQNSLNSRLITEAPDALVDWVIDANNNDALRVEAKKTDPNAVRNSVFSLREINIEPIISTMATPFLLVNGQNDPVVSGASYEQNAHFPEHIHTITFEGSGHFPMLEETNKFNRLMADFLALSSGVSPRQLQLKEEWKRRVR